MTEHTFYKEMIYENIVSDASVKASACTAAKPKSIVWRRAAVAAALCIAVLIGTVFAIPSARAEVLRWFRSTSSSEYITDYLAGDPFDRETEPELQSMLSSPNGNVVPIPIDRTDSKAINSEKALEVSAFLYDNCDIALGDAIYDGTQIFQSIRLNGLSGLFLLEPWVGGLETAVPVDPAKVKNMYEPGLLEEYLSDGETLYEQPNAWILYEYPDGTRSGGSLDLTSAIEPYLVSLRAEGLRKPNAPLTAEERQRLNVRNREYLMKNGVVAVAPINPVGPDAEQYWAQYTDADGKMTVKVFYNVRVIEADWPVPDTELFYAELGTITIDMNAYRRIAARALAAANASAFTWGRETVEIGKSSYDGNGTNDARDDRLSFTGYRVPMEGLTIRLEPENASVSVLGIRNIRIRITPPDSWTDGEREALLQSLQFGVLLNGERGDWHPYARVEIQPDNTLLWTVKEIQNVPPEMLSSLKTVSFYPRIYTVRSRTAFDENGNEVETIDLVCGETVTVSLGAYEWRGEDVWTEYPDYAVTLVAE